MDKILCYADDERQRGGDANEYKNGYSFIDRQRFRD